MCLEFLLNMKTKINKNSREREREREFYDNHTYFQVLKVDFFSLAF